jgi:hypothetical protein
VPVLREIAKCRVQKAKVKIGRKDTMTCGYPSTVQFEIYNLQFALAAAKGRAVYGGCDES